MKDSWGSSRESWRSQGPQQNHQASGAGRGTRPTGGSVSGSGSGARVSVGGDRRSAATSTTPSSSTSRSSFIEMRSTTGSRVGGARQPTRKLPPPPLTTSTSSSSASASASAKHRVVEWGTRSAVAPAGPVPTKHRRQVRRRVPTLIRLETLGAGGTRCIIYCTYVTLIIAIVLTILLKLQFDTGVVTLLSPPCGTNPAAALHTAPGATSSAPESVPDPGSRRGWWNTLRGASHSEPLLGRPRPYGACVAPGPTGNSTVWTAEVLGMSELSGDVTLSLSLDYPTPAAFKDPPPFVLYSSTVSGSVKGSSKYRDLYVINNHTFPVVCSDGFAARAASLQHPFDPALPQLASSPLPRRWADGPKCQDVSLVNSFTSTRGLGGGGFRSYKLVVSYDKNLTSFGLPSYTFRYRLASFRVAITVVRSLLILVTLYAIVKSLLLMLNHREPFQRWLPQRKWVFFLLVSVLFWQNPVAVATQLMRNVEVGAQVASSACQALGWSGIFVFWLLIMDSLKYAPLQLPKGFYLWKLLFGAAFTLSVFFVEFLQRASTLIFHGRSLTHSESQLVLRFSLAVGIMFVALLVTWLVWFIRATWTTRRVLRSLPYASTRFQQLCYRFFVFQQVVVVLFVVTVNAIPIVQFFSAYIKHPNLPSSTATSTSGSNVSSEEWLSNLLSNLASGRQQIGELLLLSIYSYFMAVCFLPPSHRQTLEQSDQKYMAVSGEQGEPTDEDGGGEGADDDSSSRSGLHRFSLPGIGSALNLVGTVFGIQSGKEGFGFNLNTASWLFDFSWGVYFDPPQHPPTLSAFGPMHSTPHDFELDAMCHDPVTDTTAMVFRKGERIVVAFRGTASKQNFLTDLKFTRGTVEFGDEKHFLVDHIPGVREALTLVHSGFWIAYSSIKDQLRSVIQTSLIEAGPRARLFTTGHSLGGALATIASLDLRRLVKENQFAFSLLPGSGSKHQRQTSAPSVHIPRATLRALGGNSRDPSRRRNPGAPRGRTPPMSTGTATTTPTSEDSFKLDTPSSLPNVGHYEGMGRSSPHLLGPGRRGIDGAVVGSSRQGAHVADGWWSDDSDGAESPGFFSSARGEGGPRSDPPRRNRSGSSSPMASARQPLLADEEFKGGDVDDEALDDVPPLGTDCLSGVGIVPQRIYGHKGNHPDRCVISYTFGSPRVGNSRFAAVLDAAVPHTYRIVFDGDIITGIPKFLWMYKHVGTEVVLDLYGNLIVDPSFVESAFRSRSKRSFKAHSMVSYGRGLLQARKLEGLPFFVRPAALGADAPARLGDALQITASDQETPPDSHDGGPSDGLGSTVGAGTGAGVGAGAGTVLPADRDAFARARSTRQREPGWEDTLPRSRRDDTGGRGLWRNLPARTDSRTTGNSSGFGDGRRVGGRRQGF